jgi:hypothetical protein
LKRLSHLDFKDDHVLAICRALGIISKIITDPYYERSADEKTTALYRKGSPDPSL